MHPFTELSGHDEWLLPEQRDDDDDGAASTGTGANTGGGGNSASATITEIADAADDASTAYSLGDNDVFSGTVGSTGDVDWIAITLEAGAHLTLVQDNVSLGATNTLLTLYDAGGTQIYTNPFNGESETYYDIDESTIVYQNTSSSTQIVYVAATSFSGATGSYTVTAQIQNFGVGTNEEIAEFLSTSWFGTQVAFDVAPGGTITYDISDLDPDEQYLAITAMEAWTMVTGINFAAHTGGGTPGITFVNDNNGDATTLNAFAGPNNIVNNVIGSSTVTISSSWVDTYGNTLSDYGFQTYMHEIGHAMGLIHAGPYNGTATYSPTGGADNLFINDSTQLSLMSYFFPYELTGGSFVDYSVLTPMMADILAMQALYGTAGFLRDTDTVYGVNSTAGGYYDLFTSQTADAAVTIIDDGGIDTIDLSTATEGSTISLVAGTFSSIGTGTNNLAIFQTSTIENFSGGSGNDTVTGNAVTNVILGGAGNDTIFGAAGNDVISGDEGDDSLDGGTGNDLIVADEGDNTLTGGGDADIFVFDGAENNSGNRITDFGADDFIFLDRQTNALSFSTSGGDAVVNGITMTGGATGNVRTISMAADINPDTVPPAAVQALLGGDLTQLAAYGAYTVTTFDANGDEGFWTDAYFYTSTALLTSRTIIYDDQTSLTIDYDETNTNGWTQIAFSFEAGGALTNRVTTLDTGALFSTFYDTTNVESWATSTTGKSVSNATDYQDILYDDNTRIFTDYDQDNAIIWTTALTFYNAGGQQTSRRVNYDDGRFEVTYQDYDGSKVWTTKIDVYTNGVDRDFLNEYNDDGTRKTTDFDQAGTETWSLKEIFYNTSGVATSFIEYNDDGTNRSKVFDAGNSQVWDEILIVYDASGAQDYRRDDYDDGSYLVRDFDNNNTETWDTWFREFDSNDVLINEYFI
ncbi:M10 family metallopeptidase [Hasllibacter sp. MH4015]|uniref:M10 family metallopeptidase n=1 Tax=Hasllibacter sp. MH4015 TaxID=2854029 RepID=UPI001CD63FDE|nr:M10 family metallopeptidase [Hasllibacter sp. MH4015]